ncbi:MAG: amidohydrolase family protein [Planctomycetota bacterium]|nr:amidohydrolase family protein [Planctomycetota bacterium]
MNTAVLITAAGILDAASVEHAPGALLLGPAPKSVSHLPFAWTVFAAGAPGEVARHPAAAAATRIAMPDTLLTPAFANAHTHLDLTALGPRRFDPERGFIGGIDSIRADRRTTVDAAAESLRLGVERSLAGGVVAVGDIIGGPPDVMRACVAALRDSPLVGAAFLEAFGLPPHERIVAERLVGLAASMPARAGGVHLGLQPHAPYSAGPLLYAECAKAAEERGLALSSHLAESMDERRFVAEATGLFRTFLEHLGLWSDAIFAPETGLGAGRHPIEHIGAVLESRPAPRWLFAHCNDAPDKGIEILARLGASVAYCPRSSAYFGHPGQLGPHRWSAMRDAGVNVCLGTDSIVGLTPESSGGLPRISPLDEIRVLHAATGADPKTLLEMATLNPAKALGLDPSHFEFNNGAIAGIAAIRLSDDAAWRSPREQLVAPDVGVELLSDRKIMPLGRTSAAEGG